jgi:undecaprenyl pyrophosphate phosphatase UppP
MQQQQITPPSSGPIRSSSVTPTSSLPQTMSSVAPGQLYRSSNPTTPAPALYGQGAIATRASVLAKVSLVIACLSLVALIGGVLPIVAALVIGIAVVASFCSIRVLRTFSETKRSRVFAIWSIVLSILAILGEVSRLVFHF